MKLECVVVLLLVLLASAAALPGEWYPIKNINDPFVRKVAEFAVTEHNKNSGKSVKLEKVILGSYQYAVEFYYELVISVADGSTSRKYIADVWGKVKVSEDSWQLVSFIPE